MEPTIGLFSHYFHTWPTDKSRWLSLIRHQGRPLFRPFTTSYKKFKVGFFKVVIIPDLNHFYNAKGKLFFPYYWKQVPRRYDDFPKNYLLEAEKHNMTLLEKLT